MELYQIVDNTVPERMVLDCNVFGSRADSSMLEKRERGLVVSGDVHGRDWEAKV